MNFENIIRLSTNFMLGIEGDIRENKVDERVLKNIDYVEKGLINLKQLPLYSFRLILKREGLKRRFKIIKEAVSKIPVAPKAPKVELIHVEKFTQEEVRTLLSNEILTLTFEHHTKLLELLTDTSFFSKIALKRSNVVIKIVYSQGDFYLLEFEFSDDNDFSKLFKIIENKESAIYKEAYDVLVRQELTLSDLVHGLMITMFDSLGAEALKLEKTMEYKTSISYTIPVKDITLSTKTLSLHFNDAPEGADYKYLVNLEIFGFSGKPVHDTYYSKSYKVQNFEELRVQIKEDLPTMKKSLTTQS